MGILEFYQKYYEDGHPLLDDSEYDYLERLIGVFSDVGVLLENRIKNKHRFPMYSLEKKFDDDVHLLDEHSRLIKSPKLDGAAISLVYHGGMLLQATTRGNGVEGEDCTPHVLYKNLVPYEINTDIELQVTGEVVAPASIANSRNYASGALHLKNLKELDSRELTFIAYGLQPYFHESYNFDMEQLKSWGFYTVVQGDWLMFPQDGVVYRLNDNKQFNLLGYTNKHPRGAYARKKSSDVAVEETVLRSVSWQVGKQGQVTPVANFDEIIIDDARIRRATLHNAGFIEALDLSIGDTLLVTRSGGIIPKVLGKL